MSNAQIRKIKAFFHKVKRAFFHGREYLFSSGGECHRNILLWTLADMGISHIEYELSPVGITPLTRNSNKAISELFKK